MRHTLRSLDAVSLDRLRSEAILLKEAGHDYASIGERLRVTTIAARDLCQQQRRSVRRQLSGAGLAFLPESVVDLFINGPHAELVARTMATRMKYLAKIGSLYTRAELLRERGLGRATLVRIENWLAAQGCRLREEDESLSEALCRVHRQKSRCVVSACLSPPTVPVDPPRHGAERRGVEIRIACFPAI